MQDEFRLIPASHLKVNELSPRRVDELSVRQLRLNIEKLGILQNLVVTPNKERPGLFTIIVGEQRWRAVGGNGDRELPCKVIDEISQEDQILMMLSENQLRKNFTATEVGKLVQGLEARGWNLHKISEHLGISEGTLKEWVKLEKEATPKTKEALAPIDVKRVPKGNIGTQAAEVITSLPISDEKKDEFVEQQIKQRVPVKTLGHLRKIQQEIPELPTIQVFEKIKDVERVTRIENISEGSQTHKEMIASAQVLLESNGFNTKVNVTLVGERPDVVGVKGKEAVVIEAETLTTVLRKRRPRIEGYTQSYVLALSTELLGRFDQIWFVDGSAIIVSCRISGRQKGHERSKR